MYVFTSGYVNTETILHFFIIVQLKFSLGSNVNMNLIATRIAFLYN